jgi:hypothetical protein
MRDSEGWRGRAQIKLHPGSCSISIKVMTGPTAALRSGRLATWWQWRACKQARGCGREAVASWSWSLTAYLTGLSLSLETSYALSSLHQHSIHPTGQPPPEGLLSPGSFCRRDLLDDCPPLVPGLLGLSLRLVLLVLVLAFLVQLHGRWECRVRVREHMHCS